MTSSEIEPVGWPPRPGVILSRAARAEAAQRRGQSAGKRAEQLAKRRQQLAQGSGPTPADITRAKKAVRNAMELNVLALARAVEAHNRSTRLHLRTADVLESFGFDERADAHRQAAADSDLVSREAERRLHYPPYSVSSAMVPAAPLEVVDTPPCPSCGSLTTIRIHHMLSLCSECGQISRVLASTAPCESHVWITSAPEIDLGTGVPVEEHCAICGEIRLVAPD